jgi:hypothetical protein
LEPLQLHPAAPPLSHATEHLAESALMLTVSVSAIIRFSSVNKMTDFVRIIDRPPPPASHPDTGTGAASCGWASAKAPLTPRCPRTYRTGTSARSTEISGPLHAFKGRNRVQ